jgi:endogenous inhibitor of DNA gyrase (YacG/DUF329 family)
MTTAWNRANAKRKALTDRRYKEFVKTDNYPENCEHCGVKIEQRPQRPRRFCSRRCSALWAHANGRVPPQKLREGNPNWHGGKSLNGDGYVLILVKSERHTRLSKSKRYQLEHRVVMAKKLGRSLEPHETVHHINGIKTDNRPENLELWTGRHGRGIRARDAFVMPPGAYC